MPLGQTWIGNELLHEIRPIQEVNLLREVSSSHLDLL